MTACIQLGRSASYQISSSTNFSVGIQPIERLNVSKMVSLYLLIGAYTAYDDKV